MFAFLVVVHVLVSVSLVASVLMQSGRGGGLAGVFGESSATQAMFGGRGAATFLSRASSILGATFFLTSMLLAILTTSGQRLPRSLIQEQAQQQGAPASTQTPSQQQTPPPSGGTAPPATQPASPPAGGSPR